MAPPTLVSLCMKMCIKNINSLTDVGDFEYWKIEPVLKHVKSPDQLREIEVNCPQIKGEDSSLWKKFIADVDPQWHLKNYVPKNPQKWYEIYRKYKREAEEKLRQDEESLRNAMLGLNKEKAEHTSVLVSAKTLPRLPRDPRMRPNNGGVPLGKHGKGGRTANESVLTWGTGSRTKTTDSKSVLLRARREAKEMSMRNKLGVPANRLRGSVVRQAPQGMVDEYRRAAIAPLKIYAPKKSSFSGAIPPIRDSAREAGERRLRALTSGRNQGVQRPGTVLPRVVSDDDTSFDEEPERRTKATLANTVKSTMVSDDDESDAADLFDERPSLPKKRVIQAPTRRAVPPATPEKKVETQKLLKPSDLISSLVSKSSKTASTSNARPKPQETSMPSPARPRPVPVPTKSLNPTLRPGSPAVPAAAKPIIRKRPQVDVFNRQAKKPRRT